jgi:ribonuclease BN (tRNA processing enzyme)
MLSEAGQKAGVPLDYAQVDKLILTHLHGDHSNGLEEWLLYRYFILKQRPTIYTSPEVAADLWEHKLSCSLMWNSKDYNVGERTHTPEDFYDLVEVPFGSSFEIGAARFETRQTIHPLPTFGLKVHHENMILGYSCDTVYDPAHIEWLSEADLIFHECNMGPHTGYEELVALDASLRGRMRLVHVSENFDIGGSVIPVLEQGRMMSLLPGMDNLGARGF